MNGSKDQSLSKAGSLPSSAMQSSISGPLVRESWVSWVRHGGGALQVFGGLQGSERRDDSGQVGMQKALLLRGLSQQPLTLHGGSL